MIKTDTIFDDIESFTSLWIGDDVVETADLASVADIAIDRMVPFVSMSADVVKMFWPWVEGKNIKILTRFNFKIEKNQDIDVEISAFAKNVTAIFRDGAAGAQIFIPCSQIAEFVDAVRHIRDDLFFDRYLSIGIDLDDTENINWADVFNTLSKIRPDSILIVGRTDKFNPNSNFVGCVFDMLEKWNLNADLHLMFGKNMLRVTQVLRLVEKMRPEISKNMRVFFEK
ncbi:MAG: hypothetical protein J5620_03820 [Alphaproteobacteria bacterium]|nr:hypothetical protein [Alphaproteobacteria bacterium]